MKTAIKDFEKLQQALKTAHIDTEKTASDLAGDAWRAQVMQSIRSVEPHDSQTDFFRLFETVVWRLAPAATLFLIVLSALVAGLDFIPEYEIVSIFIPETENLTIAQTFGL
jgi:hypothetical protein